MNEIRIDHERTYFVNKKNKIGKDILKQEFSI
jgi:hypothetical protein